MAFFLFQAWVDVSGLYFAGSHGFEIVGPHGSRLNYTFAHELLPSIQEALAMLQTQVRRARAEMVASPPPPLAAYACTRVHALRA